MNTKERSCDFEKKLNYSMSAKNVFTDTEKSQDLRNWFDQNHLER